MPPEVQAIFRTFDDKGKETTGPLNVILPVEDLLGLLRGELNIPATGTVRVTVDIALPVFDEVDLRR